MDRVVEYLNTNGDLRRALGIRPDAELKPAPIGEGEHNRNYRFEDVASGRAFVLRVNVAAQPFHEDQAAYEFAALAALEPSGCTPRPYYLDNTPEAPGKGALVIGYCEGSELDFDHLRPGDLERAARLMAEVHAVPVRPDCPLHHPVDAARELFDECLARFELYRASAAEDPRVTRWVERFIAAAAPAVDAGWRATSAGHIVNTEPLPSHFLLPDAAHGEGADGSGISAACRVEDPTAIDPGSSVACDTAGRVDASRAIGSFIDWERPIVGEVAQDLAYFTAPTTTFWDSDYLFPASDVDAFVEMYWHAVDGRFEREDFEERFRTYRLLTALRSITWCCRALVPGARLSEKAARKLPVYLSDDFLAEVLSVKIPEELYRMSVPRQVW